MSFQLLIDNGDGYVDYTQYVIPETITVEDSITVPTLLSFTLVNTNNAFIVPLRSAYCRLLSGKFGIPLATGFVSAVPQRSYLGAGNNVPTYNFQRYSYSVQVTSDEWLLNVKTVPFLPPFVNIGQGQLLAQLANVLVPNFFDTTSFVASGDIIPYFPYDPTQNWSDLAKSLADQARFRYKVLDRVIYFQPYGDGPLGVVYDETLGQGTFYPDLMDTPVQPFPPVNDAIVIGGIEAQNNHEDYFVGDGITGNFPLRYPVFEGSSSILIQEPWTEDALNTSIWNIQDPTFAITIAGGGCQLQGGDGLGSTYLVANSGIELGGAVNVQVGDFQFVDVCSGIVGGLYSNSALLQSQCIAGFQLAGTVVVPTASGAIGVTMQPMLLGNPLGPIVTSQENHSYFLQMYLSCNTWSRYDRPYRTLAGDVFGDVNYAGVGTVTFIITDTSVDEPNNPTNTVFSVTGVSLPEFCLFAPINASNLNLALTNTLLALPPQGGLYVRSLYGATANQFPIFPPGPEIQYLLGFGFQNQVATISQSAGGNNSTGDINQLSFYASSYQTLIGSTLPSVGARIRLQAFEAGTALARVQDPSAIAAEGKIVGDDGHRTAMFTQLSPLPRTSSECEAAGAAIITDRANVQYEGTYTFQDYFLQGTGQNNPVFGTLPGNAYPVPGRYLYVNSPIRGISGLQMLVRRVTIKVVELRQEILTLECDFGPDSYLEKTLENFTQPPNVLTPTEASIPPTPQELEEVGEFYLDNFENAQIVNYITGYGFLVDLGVTPVTGCEVRKTDFGWTHQNNDLLLTVTTRQFCLPRKSNEEIYYLRQVNGGLYSRFSKVLRVLYPLVPNPPSAVIVDFSVPLAPVLRVQLPINTDRDIYGVQIDNGGAVLEPPSQVTLVSDDPTDNRLVILTGFDAAGNPLLEEFNMAGTGPVTSINTYAILEFVQFPGCGGGIDGAGMGPGAGAGGSPTPSVLVITTTIMPNGTIGNLYDVFLTATGGTPPYTWSLAGGALPPGLTLSPEGEISGTPTTAGTYTFIIQVTDSSMMMARRTVEFVL